jgi:flagellar biosynthesis protein FlhF
MKTLHDTEIRTKRTRPGGAPLGRGLDTEYADVFDDNLEAGARDVRDRLLEHGASASFTAFVVRQVVASEAQGAFAIDEAAAVIGRSVPILPSPKRARGAVPHVFAFVGPTGSGKTTTLAKLGRKLAAAGRRVVFASMDPVGMSALERVGGVEADVDRAEIPLVAIKNADELKRFFRKSSDAEVVLLDTPGFSPRDEAGLDQLAREIDRIGSRGSLDVFLVLPGTKSRSALALACRAFARMAPTGCVLSKLDETDEPIAAVEEAVRAKLPIAFLCDGQDARANVVRPTAGSFADLSLRGKLA